MSILKKLLSMAGKTPESRRIQQRDPRIAIKPLHRVGFKLASGGKAGVLNLSAHGVGLVREDVPSLKVDDRLQGQLIVGDLDYPVSATVRHASGPLVGCEFADTTAAIARAIEEYFRIEILGLKLRRMNPEFLKPDPDGEPRWFTDGSTNELYFARAASGNVPRFHMTVLGHYLEGGEGKALKTGKVGEDWDERTGSRIAKSAPIVEASASSSRQAVELARQLVRNVAEMTDEERATIERLLCEGVASSLAPV